LNEIHYGNHGNDKENQCDHNNILVNLSNNINRYTYIIKPVYKRHPRETWKCALYEQLPFTYRLLLYALFISGKHTLRWQKYFTFCVHKVTLPDKNVLRLPITLLTLIIT